MMLGLELRKEFKGRRLKGTAIELTNRNKTGATQVPASDFLKITYPTADVLKTIEAVGPNHGRPVTLKGERGQGKSHLMGMIYHAFTENAATSQWLSEWGNRLSNEKIADLPLRSGMVVISESLHRQRYKFLWDLLFEQHPHGDYCRGKWESSGDKKTDVPSDEILHEMFKHTPTALILDEFQTWYDGLTNTKQYPWRNWAFNFIQILSEIAKEHPDLLALALSTLQVLQAKSPDEAWQTIFDYAWNICIAEIAGGKPDAEVTRQDRAVGDLDLFMATAGWDLWASYETVVPRTSAALVQWWESQSSGRAVLILDALSLRESPWIIHGATERGFTVHDARATGAELPADTTPFARALGFFQRSALGNNGAGSAHKLTGARTESTDIAWKDCADFIGSEPDWVFWHHWPDHRLHDHDEAGKGLSTLTREVREHLTGDDFWSLVERLATGRRVVITSDHGYAASGLFPDSNKNQTDYLKKTFKSGRWIDVNEDTGHWVPPIDLSLNTRHGRYQFVLGRRKWKSAGGYPTLTHGGLSVLEVVVPWIELTKA